MIQRGPRAIAQQLDSWGLNVLPTPPQQKSPRVAWKQWANESASHLLPSWFPLSGSLNYWAATGGVSCIYVLDVDSDKADRWWREAVGFAEAMDSTVRVKSAKGTHYYFFVPATDRAKGWAYHEGGIEFDVRGTGGGVIVPPSIHESGAVYEWVQAPNPELPMMGMQPAPDWMKSREGVRKRVESLGHTDNATLPSGPEVPASNTASMLSALLAKPPVEGGRNDWLARVAGHYAKTYRQQQDLYYVHVKQAAARIKPPLPDFEVRKLVNSIWSKEVVDHPERDMESAGWLLSGGDRILTQVRYGKGEDTKYGQKEWADFNMRVQGVLARDGDEGDLIYDVIVIHKRNGYKQQALLDGATLGSGFKLMAWLAGMGLAVARPENAYPVNPPDNIRLLRYLASQSAPRARMAPALGWDEASKAFLTYDGVIRADGLHPFDRVRPNPDLVKNGLRYDYGFQGNLAEARAALAEVLTFHDQTTAAVFGSWWAACMLKPQFSKVVALFPIMAIEAASGAGKTNGMFKLLIQLAGNIDGPGTMTYAVARNRLASHQSGIAWLDDLESVDGKLLELMRVLTSGEEASKMAPDNNAVRAYTLRAPLVVSGEYLGFGSQKALLDRIVMLNPPKPDTRMSQKPGREHLPQWDDIIDFNERYPEGPWTVSGHLIARALTLETRALAYLRSNLREVKETLTGRPADRLAVLIAGAWVLDRLLADLRDDEIGPWEQQLRDWATTGASVLTAGEWDNRLTLDIAPWALRERQWPTSAKGAPPVWVAESTDMFGPTVWVNVPCLAETWRDHLRGRTVERTDTAKALLDQVRRCQTAPHSRRFDVYQGNRRQLLYWGLTGEVAETIIERSQE